jgi:hypothetical protein
MVQVFWIRVEAMRISDLRYKAVHGLFSKQLEIDLRLGFGCEVRAGNVREGPLKSVEINV